MITKTYNQDLSGKNTFRMKVSCRCMLEYDSLADLFDMDFEEMLTPLKHIGAGSNILFTDDFKGTILHSKINFIEDLGDGLVSVGSGVLFDDFCLWAAQNGYWGPENLSHIPGEVGAAAVQNIGAYGVEFKDVAKTIYCYDIEDEDLLHFDVSECGYAYRDSFFKGAGGRYIITHVVFKLTKEPSPKLEYGNLRDALRGKEITPMTVRDAVTAIRKAKLPEPSEIGSAGSFFKNPIVEVSDYERVVKVMKGAPVPHFDLPDGKVKIPAAFLIEQCGWKGRRSGNVAVYEKQPLVIVNYTGMALPDEVISLESKIKVSVREKFGIELSPEVEHV